MREKIPTTYLNALALKTRTANGLNYVFEAYDLQVVALQDIPGKPHLERIIVGDWSGDRRGTLVYDHRAGCPVTCS
jgi:hypothetical protein